MQQKLSKGVQITEWNNWKEFCILTKREYFWAERFKTILNPTNVLLDVGCGTGEFASALTNWANKVIGIDVVDYRTKSNFDFYPVTIEKYNKETPNLIVYKQSFHLISSPFSVQSFFPEATIVLLQMKKPLWEKDCVWDSAPYDIYANKKEFDARGYATWIHNEVLQFNLEKEVYKKLILEGFTSDLRKLSYEKRQEIWNNIKQNYNNIYSDKLDILIAKPLQKIKAFK
jgi:SAM-dependent methyltransferase